MKRILSPFLAACVCVVSVTANEETVSLDNGTARMVVNCHGGGVSSFTLSGSDLNPFSWRAKKWVDTDHSKKEGLFLCFDRSGFPSEADQARGIPFHGEATSQPWKVLERTSSEKGELLRMRCDLPVANMSVEREYLLFPDSSVCRITDRFINHNAAEKKYSILIHPSIGAPFLDGSVVIDCNADKGFFNSRKAEEMPGNPLVWPSVERHGQPVDLRKMTGGGNMVANYRCAPGVEQGWACAANPEQGLFIGLLWNTDEYPWMRMWRNWKDGQPDALGLEFGTSPLGIPFEEIEQVGDIFGLPTLHALPPAGEMEKTFYVFLARVSADYEGTKKIALEEGRIVLEDSKGKHIPLPSADIQ